MTISGLLRQYAAYDVWGNKQFVDRLIGESEAVLDRHVSSSFPSLRATLMHIRDAENAWRCRLKNEKAAWPAESSTSIDTLMHYSSLLHDHVDQMRDEDLLRTIAYTDLRGNEYRQPAWEMIMHCFNHSTQHRGQLITMMRALEMDRIPSNDLARFQRELKANF